MDVFGIFSMGVRVCDEWAACVYFYMYIHVATYRQTNKLESMLDAVFLK